MVDIGRIPGLADITVDDDGAVTLGALVRHEQANTSPVVAEHAPLIAETMPWVAHRAIRTRGTVLGSIAHGDPAAEMPAVVIATGATLVATSASGQREIAADDFFEGYLDTALRADEILTEVTFPAWPANAAGSVVEVARRHGDYALVGLVTRLEVDGDNVITDAALAFFGAASTAVRVPVAEETLVGAPATADTFAAAAQIVSSRTEPTRRHPRHHRLPQAPRRHPHPPRPRRRRRHDRSTRMSDSPNSPPPHDSLAAERTAGGSVDRRRVHRQRRRHSASRVEARRTLSDVIREDVGLTGTHLGCEHGVCGACTVLVDGQPARSCLMLAGQAEGAEITTIEGLARPDGSLHPIQQAMMDAHGFQCAFCSPGFLMSAVALLEENPNPTTAEIREELSGNLCRCTGYQSIVAGVERAVEIMKSETKGDAS